MDAVMFVVTFVSLMATLVMSIVTWRVVREDRRRAGARVAQITAEIGLAPTGLEAFASRPASTTAVAPESTGASEPANAATPLMGPIDAISLFAPTQQTTEWWRPLGVIIPAGVVISGLVVSGLFLSRGSEDVVATVEAAPAPLELVALDHARDGDALTVTGLVRNPSTESSIHGATAVVFLFDRQGAFAGSGRAPVDFATLAPAEEVPFTIRTENDPAVGRYRISFRNQEGAILPHVDRRQDK